MGSYQLGARLGEGGSSEVYRAAGPDGVEVAVKILGPHAELDDERARRRFLREIELVGELDHPNLVKLLDSGVDPELGPYLVTELVDGPSLRELGGPAGPDVAALVGAPIAEAVAELHRAGLVHRDLKPENVIVTGRGEVVLIDLGLARRPGHTRYTDEGEVVGSVPYMAPEQIEGREVTGAADVWALGVLLYELGCGVRPFARERPSEEAAAALVGSYEPIGRRDRRAPPSLAALIDRCLSADPGARPAAADVAATLAEALDWSDDLVSERARWVGARERFMDPVSEFRAVQIGERAGRSSDAFERLALVDRGLAYRPSDPRLLALAEVPPPVPARRSRWWIAGVAGAVGLIGLAIALAAVPAGDVPLEITRPEIEEPPLELARAEDPGAASRRRSDQAARRVASGFGQLVLRGLAAEPDASGKLVARQGGPGEASNEELTLAVFGGLLDLFEEGVDAKQREAAAGGGETITIPALDPARLRDDDRPRDPSLLEAGAEPLIVMEGKTADQIAVVTRELERQLGERPRDPSGRMALIAYRMAGGDVARGERELASLRADEPRFAHAAVFAALIASRRGDHKKALALLDEAIGLDPDNEDALALRGRVRFRLGQTAGAYRDLRAAIAADSRTSDAFAGLAELYHALGADPSPMIDQLRALAAQPEGGAKAARRLRELCDRGVKPAC